jgi:hypothetical protein
LSAADVPGALHGYSVQALKREVRKPKNMHPLIALEELLRRQAPGFLGMVRQQLARAEDETLRASCAALLGGQKTAANRAALQAALQDASPDVVRRAAEALGRIGEAEELAALRAMRTRKPVVRRSIDAAKTLLSYTLGETRGLLPAPAAEELLTLGSAKSAPIRVTTVDTERFGPSLSTGLPGIQASATACLIDCQRWRYLLVFNRRVFTRKAAVLAGRPCVLGALLRSETATGRFVHYASVLSHPQPGEPLQLSVMRPNGVVLYHGELSPADWQFRVRALNSRHVLPVVFTGTLDIDRQTLTASRAEVALRMAGKQPPSKRPTPILTRID